MVPFLVFGIALATPNAPSFHVGTVTVVQGGLLESYTTVALANRAEGRAYEITSIRTPTGAPIGSEADYPRPLGSSFIRRSRRAPQEGVYTAVVSGEEGPVELEVELETPDFLAPPLFTFEETPRGLRVSWAAVERAQGYLLEVYDVATLGRERFVRLATTERGVTVRRRLPPGSYEIVVQAYDFPLTGLLMPPRALDVAAFPETFAMGEAKQIVRIESP